jgi:signal transduction histidine kinase
LAAVGALLAAFVLVALILPQSFRLTAFCDVTETLLLMSGVASFVPLAFRSRGRMRLFWSLIIFGITLWLCYQFMWIYYELVLHREVPDIFAGDMILFLNIVPLMAALALRPHIPRDEYSARLRRLDFALLLVWWFYLYALIVIPWQYVVPNVDAYDFNLNGVYTCEKLAFLAGVAACWRTSKDAWRKFYASLFCMGFCYAASSAMANWAIAKNAYYSGSLFDIPLAVAMAWLTWIGLRTKVQQPKASGREVSTAFGIWVARCSMIAIFSLPLFAAWALSDPAVPSRVRLFRLGLTLAAAFVMGLMVFFRQHLLEGELIHLLNHSHESFNNLKQLQSQILQSEKLASIGQLVGGAAHELNNPITAMLGYSDLLLSTHLTAEQAPIAAKIGQHVRRTKSLVASLISFARQSPSPKTAIDLNTLARTAIKLTQPQWKAMNVEVRTEFDTGLPKVLGDSNQLLQVCLQLVGNCVHFMSEQGGKILTISTEQQDGVSVLQIAADTHTTTQPSAAVDSTHGLALTACRGILQEHHGHLSRESRPDGSTRLRVELPAIDEVSKSIAESTLSELWQSRPYA